MEVRRPLFLNAVSDGVIAVTAPIALSLPIVSC
jgi:hypothetical protein